MDKQTHPVRILITDDHAIFRDGLRRLLESEPGLEVCGEAANGHETLESIDNLHPALLLLDLAMPPLPGLEVLARLSLRPDAPRTIVLTAAADPPQIIRAFQLGARGVVLKESATRVLFDSIQCVIDGGYWVGEKATKDMVESVKALAEFNQPRQLATGYGLTARELQIVTAILEGLTNKEIASKFAISEQTVKNNLTNIFDKIGVSNRLELGLFVQGQGLRREN